MAEKILVTIPTMRLEESISFYVSVLQFKLDNRYDHPGGVVLVFLSKDGFTIELVANPHMPIGEVGTGAPHITFTVQSFTEITSRCEEHRIQLPTPLNLPGGVSILRFKDPNGVEISFVVGGKVG